MRFVTFPSFSSVAEKRNGPVREYRAPPLLVLRLVFNHTQHGYVVEIVSILSDYLLQRYFFALCLVLKA